MSEIKEKSSGQSHEVQSCSNGLHTKRKHSAGHRLSHATQAAGEGEYSLEVIDLEEQDLDTYPTGDTGTATENIVDQQTRVRTVTRKGTKEKSTKEKDAKGKITEGKSAEGRNAARIIHRRRYNIEVRKGYQSLFFRAVLLLAAGWLLLTQFLLLTQAPDNGMYPAINAGDLIVAYRLQTSYSKDDVIVYTVDGEQKIGRIIACETDVVTMDDSGTLRVNGTVQTGDILFSTYVRGDITYPFTVPEGCVYVLCDYRTEGTDSRDYGAIPLEDIQGKVITILRRRNL